VLIGACLFLAAVLLRRNKPVAQTGERWKPKVVEAKPDAERGKHNAARLLGTWKVVRPGTLTEPGSLIEFAADGTLTISPPAGVRAGPNAPNSTYEYTVDGDTLTIRRLMVSIIKTLTDTTVVLEGRGMARPVELKRVK
jgi:hypothetical protein